MSQEEPVELDPVIRTHREQIAALDVQILEAINQRIILVRNLKDHKVSRGVPFHDAAQEDRVLASLCQANRGPLSEDGVRNIFGGILAWAKRCATRPE